MRYFAMLDTERILLIPNATTFEEAAENGFANTHWIFHEDGLRQFVARAQAALGPHPITHLPGNENLRWYIVGLETIEGDFLTFECWADDTQHAIEQAEDAYPGSTNHECHPRWSQRS
jgi:hypothetical protein